MIANTKVEKTTTYTLTKQQIIAILLREADADHYAAGMVDIKFECNGGQDPYDQYSYTPMDVCSATIKITEKS